MSGQYKQILRKAIENISYFFCGCNIVVGVENRGYRCNHFYHFRFSYKGKVAKHRIEVKKAVFVESNCQVKEGDYWDKQLFNNIS